MFSVTDAAMQHLHQSLTSVVDPKTGDKCFRLVPKDGSNLTLSLAKAVPGDATFEYAGNTVLAIPSDLQEFCSDKSLDVDESGKLELG